MASYRDLLKIFSEPLSGRRRRAKKDFCLECDTADPKKIGKGKTCEICENKLAVNPYFRTWKPTLNSDHLAN